MSMRTIAIAALSVVAVTAVAAAASAADLPRGPMYREPVFAPAASAWDGFYVGGNVGGGWAKARADFSTTGPVFGTADNSMAGFSGGAQLGYNWQHGAYVF